MQIVIFRNILIIRIGIDIFGKDRRRDLFRSSFRFIIIFLRLKVFYVFDVTVFYWDFEMNLLDMLLKNDFLLIHLSDLEFEIFYNDIDLIFLWNEIVFLLILSVDLMKMLFDSLSLCFKFKLKVIKLVLMQLQRLCLLLEYLYLLFESD